MKLGEILVGKGLVSRDQLKQALDAQLIFGGHLGTCLIERGFLEESDLGQVLAEAFNMDYARREMFHKIPRFVIAALPARLVQKHSVVPFRLENKVLDAAMIDPGNLGAVDELSFAAGFKVRPWVAPEVRIYQAMERYYDIPRRQRFLALCQQLDGAMDAEDLEGQIVRLERDAADSSSRAAASEGPAPGVADLEAISDELCRHETPERIAEAVLGHISRGVARGILFKVVNSIAYVWRSDGVELETAGSNPGFPIISEPVFGLMRGEAFYRGALPDDDVYRGFFETLRLEMPVEILVLPIYVDDRLVALFYGDGGPTGSIRGETAEFRRLMKKVGLALNLVLLRRQLRSA